jgi:hypothetical protein
MNFNMNTNATGFEDNVKKALECADNVIQSVNTSLAIACSTPEKNVKAILDELELAAVAPTQAALSLPTTETAGEEVKKIMSAGCDDFKRQTGRNMTYLEMRYAYG